MDLRNAVLVPRPCAGRQELAAWGGPQPAWPLWSEKPGRTRDEEPRHWHGQSVVHHVAGEDSDGRVAQEELRFGVVHASQLVPQHTQTYALAQAKEAGIVAHHVRQVQAREWACAAEAAATIAE